MSDWNATLVAIIQIIGIDILLSGDNAVVIALACRGLPERQRRIGVMLGAGVAVLMRIGFTAIIASLMVYPWLRAAGSVLLFVIAVKLLIPEDADHDGIPDHGTLARAILTIAIADLVMSFDNVVAIALAAKGALALIIFGLIVSVPLMVVGATLFIRLFERVPLFVWAGAALLGWIAGDMLVHDPGVLAAMQWHIPEWISGSVGAALVVAAAWLWRQRLGIAGLRV